MFILKFLQPCLFLFVLLLVWMFGIDAYTIHILLLLNLFFNFFKHPSTHINKLNFCDVCALCKHHSLPFLRLNTIYSAPLQLVVFDLWGLAHNLFRNDFKYYIRFMDVYHRYTLIYFLQSKFDAFSTF